ncbi:MAG: DegT/DnrJ/EryC1/StrS family aminotransferase [Phycisphaerae bacterium]
MIPLLNLTKLHEPLAAELQHTFQTCLESSRFIDASAVEEFCRSFAAYQQIDHAVGCANGTEALRIAILVGLGQGDGTQEVMTVSHTFFATTEAIVAAGYRPVFVDVEPDTGLMDVSQVEQAITSRTAAIVPVHLYGQMVDMVKLAAIAHRHGLPIIEDAAQAHGAQRESIHPGQRSLAATYSFFPGKNLGAFGDAGAIVTSDPCFATRCASFIDHGRANRFEGQGKHLHATFAGNSRMDALQARILQVKLRHLETWNQRRRDIASLYVAGLAEVDEIVPLRTPPVSVPVFHQFVIRHEERDSLREFLQENGIATGVHYPVPVHLQPAWTEGAFCDQSDGPALPVTEALAKRIVSLPICPTMNDETVFRVLDTLRDFCTTRAMPRTAMPANL